MYDGGAVGDIRPVNHPHEVHGLNGTAVETSICMWTMRNYASYSKKDKKKEKKVGKLYGAQGLYTSVGPHRSKDPPHKPQH